jgi:hypothetical protein
MELVICEARNCCTNRRESTCLHKSTHYEDHIGDECTSQTCSVRLQKAETDEGEYYKFRARCIPWFKGLEDSLPHNVEEAMEYDESSRI